MSLHSPAHTRSSRELSKSRYLSRLCAIWPCLMTPLCSIMHGHALCWMGCELYMFFNYGCAAGDGSARDVRHGCHIVSVDTLLRLHDHHAENGSVSVSKASQGSRRAPVRVHFTCARKSQPVLNQNSSIIYVSASWPSTPTRLGHAAR